MQVHGPLMVEHRLIERMISLMGKNLKQIEKTGEIDSVFIKNAVDFIRMYADRTHHGKEEDILFRALKNKSLSKDDRCLMYDLIEEHAFSRKANRELDEARIRYLRGDKSSLDDIVAKLRALVNIYPGHIEKEDKTFFSAARKYLSDEEEQTILKEFAEFDQKMIHEKYGSLVEDLEKYQLTFEYA